MACRWVILGGLKPKGTAGLEGKSRITQDYVKEILGEIWDHICQTEFKVGDQMWFQILWTRFGTSRHRNLDSINTRPSTPNPKT